MGVITVRTGGDDIGQIDWEVEISWKLRREIHRQKAIEMYQAGEKYLFQVDTDKLLELLWPEAIVGWDREEELSEERFWERPMIHLDRLAGQVADWLLTGREPGTGTATAESAVAKAMADRQDGQDEQQQQDGQDTNAPLGIV